MENNKRHKHIKIKINTHPRSCTILKDGVGSGLMGSHICLEVDVSKPVTCDRPVTVTVDCGLADLQLGH